MTEQTANKPSLSQLYREFAGARAAASVPDADDLLELSRVTHAEQAASPLCADLLRFSRELEPASAQLGVEVRAALEESVPGTHRRALARRGGARVRRWRGVAAIAASLLAVVGVWSLQRGHLPQQPQAQSAGAAPVQDRILASFDERSVAGTSARDEIFRDQFAAPSDVIFRSHDG
jgi:cytochrome c-type biogenesis protein CcmH/NrfG